MKPFFPSDPFRLRGKRICFLFTLLALSSCGVQEVGMTPDGSGPASADSVDSRARDDILDERRPPFIDEPGASQDGPLSPSPSAEPGTPTPPPGTPPPAQEGKGYGVNKDLSCAEWVASHWKVGSSITESAPGPVFTTISLVTEVKEVRGSVVTVKESLDAPGSEFDTSTEISFDACTASYLPALLPSVSNCEVKEIGTESVSFGGKSLRTLKVSLGPCQNSAGKTFSSVLWRAPDYPQLGIVKRELTGSILPEKLNGKLSPSLKAWSFE